MTLSIRVPLSLLAVLCVGCDEGAGYFVQESYDCEPERGAQVMAAVTACAKAANPLSDEEGEDLVAQCAATARSLLCTKIGTAVETYSSGQHERIRCAIARVPTAREACDRAGYHLESSP